MLDRQKSERREFKDALGRNWDRKRRELFPDGPRTRDDRYVAGALSIARNEDVEAILSVRGRSPELEKAWLAWHADWVKAECRRVEAEAIQRLRRMRSEALSERRRKRKNVRRNGRRTKVNKPGPKPSRKLNLTCKVVSPKRSSK